MQHMENICVQKLIIEIVLIRRFVSSGKLSFLLNLNFERLIRDDGKVALLVIFVSENHYYSMDKIFLKKYLYFLFGKLSDLIFIYVS